jgi:serine/threonine protein kinase
MGCLDVDRIRAWQGGALSGDERHRADQHLSGCVRCRERAASLDGADAGHAHGDDNGASDRAPTDSPRADRAPTDSPRADAAGVDTASPRPLVAKTQPFTGVPSGPIEPGVALPPGTRIGRFVIRRALGTGGMGTVYAAEDPELGRQVALKLLHGGSLGGGAGREAVTAARRIMREARLAARVSHPNVVSIYEVGPFGDQVFIAMELVKGNSLSRWLAGRPRSVAEILDVMVGAGRGLAAAHAAGLVHRDFKPDNVLIGSDGRAQVGDFGLARRRRAGPAAVRKARAKSANRVKLAAERAAGPDTARTAGPDTTRTAGPDATRPTGPQAVRPAPRLAELTSESAAARDLSGTGRIVGTPAYMAPEQHAGGHTDPRTDQFSFCVALYEALYRQRPFAGDSPRALAAEVRSGRVLPPPSGTRVPTSLHRLIVRGLSVHPGDRFASMGELLDALGRDRSRPLRRWAYASLVALVAVVTGLGADRVARERTLAVTRSSFAAAQGQLGRSLDLRYETFTALSDLSYVVPIIREVTGNLDQSDFGLGDEAEDRQRLAELHENLRSADWLTWARASQRGVIGVADYKGRLLFTSAAPERWGDNVRALGAVASAYDQPGGAAGAGHAMVIRGDDPRMVAAGLLGGAPRSGLYVVFARATTLGGAPRAVFVQTIEGRRLLSDVSLGEGTQLALVAPGGAAEGDIPADVLAAGRSARGTTEEVREGGRSWLASSYPLRALGGGDIEIATLVLARPIDAGLAGLFPAARLVLGLLALVLLASTLSAALWARGARLRLTATRP